MIAGRPPAGPDEIAVGYEDPARSGGPRPAIGDTSSLEMPTQKAADTGQLFADPRESCRSPCASRGWVLGFGEATGDEPGVWAGPGFVDAWSGQAWMCDAGVFQLQGDFASLTPFLASIYTMEPKAFVLNITVERVFVERSTHLTAIVLRLLAVLAAIAGIMVLGQFLVRRTSLGAIDTPVLRAVGMTRSQIVWAAASARGRRRVSRARRSRSRARSPCRRCSRWACREPSIRPSACGSTGSRSSSAW